MFRGNKHKQSGGNARVARPVWVTELELSRPPSQMLAPPAPVGDYERARILIRLQGEPIGILHVELVDRKIAVDRIIELARDEFADRITSQLGTLDLTSGEAAHASLSDELAVIEGAQTPSVSVVIGTRNRTEHVLECVAGVLKQSYSSPIEVIVVDNAPSNHETRDAIADSFGQDSRVRYLLEPAQGLSRARNAGLAAAKNEITAFLSDDIQVDTVWLRAVIRGFARHPEVRCVAGYCPPLYLDTEQQLIFEKTMAWGWRNGFEPKLIGADPSADRLYPYRLGVGTGANLSFRTDYLKRSGGFDISLGPGTLARGGEDLDAPVRVLLDGGLIAFEPAALGWHADRYDDRTFAAHMYTYGVGLTAFLASHLLASETRWRLLKLIPFGAAHLLKPAILPDGEDHFDDVPQRLSYRLANLAGRLSGPVALARSRMAAKKTPQAQLSVTPDGSEQPAADHHYNQESGVCR